MSDTRDLSEAVRHFLIRYIDSIAELEGLLLLRLDEAPWSAPSLARRLYVDQREAEAVLTALHRRGLVSRTDDGFRYAPASDTLRMSVNELAEAYPRFLIPITHLVHSKPQPSLREFADAFRLRSDK